MTSLLRKMPVSYGRRAITLLLRPGSARPARRLVVVLLGVLLAGFLLSFFRVIPVPRLAMNLLTVAAFAGAFRLHLHARPGPAELIATLAVAVGLFFAIEALVSTKLLLAVLLALGSASAIVLSVRSLLARHDRRRQLLDTLALVVLLPLFIVVARAGLYLTCLHTKTYDGTAYHIDAFLGGQASFYLGRLFHDHPRLRDLCGPVYGLLPLAIAIVAVAESRLPEPPRANILDAAVLAGIVGFALYHFCPISGPVYLFGSSFPFGNPTHVPLVSSVPTEYFRNGMPSLHTAWVLLLYFHAKRCGTDTRIFTAVWLILTELATLGLGEHYVIDLVVAVPFAVAIEAAATDPRPGSWGSQKAALLVGAGLTLASMSVVRWAPGVLTASAPATWAFVILVVTVPLVLHARMQNRFAAEAPSSAPALADATEAERS